ncbi:MAG: hypothetical protein KDA58_04590 [Planctomycetaceae bacterium]|nr:hypothetical protein [Planctomycetaceae bacterium]
MMRIVAVGLLVAAMSVGSQAIIRADDAALPADAQPASTATAAESATTSAATESAEKLVLPPPPTPWILKPYEVHVRVSWPVSPSFLLEQTNVLTEQVRGQLTQRFRQNWNLDIQTALGAQRQTAYSLLHADVDAWNARWFPEMEDEDAEPTEELTPPDKELYAVIDQVGAMFHVTTLEWCSNSRTLSPLVQLETGDRRDLAATVADAISRAFRPLAQIEVGEGDKVEFLIRGGELPPVDPQLVPFQEGQYLAPYLRYLGKKREVQRIQTIPWTYMKVVERDRSRIRIEMTSAFRQPIPQSRRRVEVMAMLLRPSWDASDIRVYPRRGQNTPLVGYRCEVVDRLPTLEDPVPERDQYYTDRRGVLTVPVPEGDPLRYLLVHSGQSVLARVPFIPGTSPLMEVEVPNDRARLGVEGEVSLLQGELIDIIATREVLMARGRAAAKKQDWDAVDKFTEEISDLPTLEQFKGRIEALQLQAVYKAREERDRAAESRIKKLCGGLIESTETHLNPGRIAEYRGEIRVLRP